MRSDKMLNSFQSSFVIILICLRGMHTQEARKDTVKEIVAKQSNDARMYGLSSVRDGRLVSTLRSVFVSVRTFATEIFTTYNYYLPEIALSKCVGRYVKENYPDILSGDTLESTARVLRTVYGLVTGYLKTLFAGTTSISSIPQPQPDPIGQKVVDMTSADMTEYLQTAPGYSDENLKNIFYPMYQEINTQNNKQYENYDNNLRVKRQNNFKSSLMPDYGYQVEENYHQANNIDGYSYLPPATAPDLLYPPLSSQTQTPSGNNTTWNPLSIFNLDDIIEEELGFNKMEEEEPSSVVKCTQRYALGLFWRMLETVVLGH